MHFYSLSQLEAAILKFFNQPIHPALNSFMIFLNFSVYIFLVLLLVYYYEKRTGILFWRRRRKKFIQLVLNLILGVVFVYILKYLIGRSRPSAEQFTPVIQKLDPSFPSSHAFISFLCLIFLPKELSSWLKLALVAYLVVAIPISALYLGIHYPTDLLVGALLGTVFPAIFTERTSEVVIGKIYRMREKLLEKIF